MEVLKSEFEAKLPLLKEAILEADFIAIDTEFTGLTIPDNTFMNNDDIERRYNKIKNCVQEFTIIQYGVCTFKKDQVTGNYVAKPFNFYIFGADTHEVQSRRIFSATASSLTFLRSNKFDFNKLIEEGIPFYNFTEEDSMFQTNQGSYVVDRRPVIQESSLTKKGKDFLENSRDSIRKWLQGNTTKPLVIQPNGGFFKKLLQQEVKDSKYNGYLQLTQIDSSHVQITRMKDEEKKKKKTANSPKLNFRAVIDLIKEANCPVVAHNAAFDIFHTVDQFWQNLPNDIKEFKKVANSMWPNFVDTKYLAEHHPFLKSCFNSTVLGSLYNTVYEELKEAGEDVAMSEGFDRYTGSENGIEHEAGYDAYMTGVIYLAFVSFIREKQADKDRGSSNNKRKRSIDDTEEETKRDNKAENKIIDKDETKEKESNHSDSDSDEESGQDSSSSDVSSSDEEGEVSDSDEVEPTTKEKNSIFMDESLTPYYGRIFLMRSDISYINLKGKETVELVACPNKFYLHNIPMGMTNGAIERLYPSILPIAISWVNDTNAWIILRDESKTSLVKLGLLGLATVQSYLPGFSRAIEGKAYNITKEAGQMELLSHEQWHATYGPNKTVNYNNMASVLMATTGGFTIEGATAKTAANGVDASTPTTNTSSDVPKGGSGYDDLDIPFPPSFAAGLKRSRESEDLQETPENKIRKTE